METVKSPNRINSLLRECMLAKIHNLPLFCSEYMHLIRVNAKEISIILREKEKQLTACCCMYTSSVAAGHRAARQCPW